jgi:hypothetical protein
VGQGGTISNLGLKQKQRIYSFDEVLALEFQHGVLPVAGLEKEFMLQRVTCPEVPLPVIDAQ